MIVLNGQWLATDSAVLADGSLTAATFAAGAITATAIGGDAITASKLAADCIGASELSAAAVTKIQAGLSTASALAVVDAEADKIALADAGGLLATADSLAYTAYVARRALNHYERWFGLATVPSGETHRADRLGVGVNPFVIDAGDNDWGAWVQVIGSADTPFVAGLARYNVNSISVTALERDAVYFIQLAFGATAADALTANTYTETAFKPSSNTTVEFSYQVRARRQAAGTKAWARCLCPGQNTATASFYLSVIEYEG